MIEKIYYVYQHFRKDNHSCIYIGKGHGKRIKHNKRNLIHDQIMSDVGIEKAIYKDNLSEEEAYQIEHDLIHHYVFDLNYGIDIEGYRKNDSLHFLTNKAWGGKGLLGLERPDHSLKMTGENNPMYGVNVWEKYSEERTYEIKAKISQASSGKNNPMYGISPQERMTPATYKTWKNKVQSRLENQTRDSNPNSKAVSLYFKDGTHIQNFNCKLDCIEWFQKEGGLNLSQGTLYSYINNSIKNNSEIKNRYIVIKK